MAGPAVLILPVESEVRELDAKLLLAGVAAERGFPVVLGSRAQVSFALPRLPRGVFFAKSMRFTSDLMTGFIRGFGHHMVASDEESLVRFDHPDYCDWRFSPRTFGALRHVFSWGDDDAELLRAYPGRGAAEVHATGNPRMDLLREDVRTAFADKAAVLRRSYGDFILINTNFPFVNNFVAGLNLIQHSAAGEPEVGRTGRGMSLSFALGMARHARQIMEAFEGLMPQLAARFPDHVIVLRPHPSENHDHWRRRVAHLPNVRVLHQGSIAPWLMAARVMLHNGCTTAVEAAVLGTPTIAYRPVASACHDYHLPNRLSIQVGQTDEVLQAVSDVLAGRWSCAGIGRRSILARHLAMAPERLACDRIVDVLADQGYLEHIPPEPSPLEHARAWIGTHGRTLVKRINLRRDGHRNSAAYLRHRFPPLEAAVVNERLQVLGRTLGRFAGIEAETIGTDLFAIRRRPVRG